MIGWEIDVKEDESDDWENDRENVKELRMISTCWSLEENNALD